MSRAKRWSAVSLAATVAVAVAGCGGMATALPGRDRQTCKWNCS